MYTTEQHFSGSDQLSISTTDLNGANDFDTVDITVNADDRALTVAGTTVNEASPYVQFQVGGVTGQWVALSLGTTGTGAGHAIKGVDFLPNLQYFNGTSWVDYTGGLVQIPVGSNTLLVRTPVVQDQLNEGAETLKLTATNQAGTAATGNSTIKDDGTGDIFDGGNNTSTPTFSDPGAGSNPNTDTKVLDDDRPLTVNSIQVNEASPFGVFTVSGAANQWAKLSLADGTATGGGTDYGNNGSGLEYWNGTAWATYTAGVFVQLDSGGKLLVRTPIIDDVPFEGSETFFLQAQNTGGKAASGTGTILDDGTGTKYPNVAPSSGPTPTTESTNLNDDRTIDVVGGLTFNEASTYATFSVTGQSGYELNLALGNGTVASATIANFTFDYSVDGGASWQTYSWNGTSGNRPMIPGSSSAGGNTGTVLVRVNITSEADTPYEGAENFTLTASYATNLSRTDTDTDTIIDDGTGKIDNDGDGGSDEGGTKDDDRPRDLAVTGGNYNEKSPRAVFTVTATPGQVLTLDVQDDAQSGKAPTGDDEGKPDDSLDTADIYYSLDGGATWQRYTGPITAGSVPVLVAVDITNERDDVFEGEEQLKLVVTSGGQSASGYSSIFDDGTGTVTKDITEQTQNDTGANDPSVTKDDDRTIAVIGHGPVNEGSQYAMFTVTSTPGQMLDLELQAATSGTPATRSGFTYEYSTDGTNWTTYDATHKPTAPANGKVFVRVDISSEADAPYEGAETFALKASFSSDSNVSAAADNTIVDDGTGAKYGPNVDPTSGPESNTNGLDDDRPKPIVLVEPLVEPSPPARPDVVPQFSEPRLVLPPFFAALKPTNTVIALGQTLTSDSGHPILVSETATPGLSLYQGITDQFVQDTLVATKISIPYDAFIHSDRNAVIKLTAKQADDSNLPSWVEFDPAAGTFTVKPPADFKGKLDLKVIARDDNGNEAVSIFQVFIGEQETQPNERKDSRNSFTEKLRLAGNRPMQVVRVVDVPQKAEARAMPQRASAG